ncbi:MAG: universal stress protein [Pirellulaceae bacterium]
MGGLWVAGSRRVDGAESSCGTCAASKVFEHIQEMFSGADVGVECVFLKGQVGKTIIEQAKSRSIELVVLGAVGHSTLDRLLLGSTSDFVATLRIVRY